MSYSYCFAITVLHVDTFTNHGLLLPFPLISCKKVVPSQHFRQLIPRYQLKYLIVHQGITTVASLPTRVFKTMVLGFTDIVLVFKDRVLGFTDVFFGVTYTVA